MGKHRFCGFICGWVAVAAVAAHGADTVPPAVQLPGTQPGEVSGIESVTRCDNCHGNFSPQGQVQEPWFNWAGSMMAHASRDPLYWAAVAIAEQDFDGSGDLCIRCHTPEGWLDGRSTPTDGSGLAEGDADGVQCDVCHRLTNPDDSEHLGEQNDPFFAHDETVDPTGYYGGGMFVISDGNAKLGPYADADANHQFDQSLFHRSSELCGTCHDVSNPVTGDLAHNFGAQTPLPPGTASGDPASPLDQKVAFNAQPYAYGVVERTFSEHQASGFVDLPVSALDTLPNELQAGSILKAGQRADYTDGAIRTFSCQTCHMPPTTGQGCNKNPPVRSDLPEHDLTGGNVWVPDAMTWLDARGELVLGGGLSDTEQLALAAGKERARQNLRDAASLSLSGNLLRVVNLTGHKLISGYPEGRRMWIAVEWYGAGGVLLAEDGRYGSITADVDGSPTQVETLLDLHDPYAPVYEAHGGLTKEWAVQLLGLGVSGSLVLAYDRETGAPTATLAELAARPDGSTQQSFHFVLNNVLLSDNRIPPWGLRRDDALERNIVPVPAEQYGDPGPGGTYDYWDDVPLNPPPGADHATIRLFYQTTSWEYLQFLKLANTGAVTHLADEGDNIVDAWLGTGMAEPYEMASVSWSGVVGACSDGLDNDGDGLVDFPDDPGCVDASDVSENQAGLPCDDRIDNDGDGWLDYPRDPGCFDPSSATEAPQCQDGIDNDGQYGTDFDGGLSVGVDDPDGADPQCLGRPWRNRERPNSCGLGVELGVVIPLLAAFARRRRARE